MSATVDTHGGQVVVTLGWEDFQASLVLWLSPDEATRLAEQLARAATLAALAPRKEETHAYRDLASALDVPAILRR